MFHDPSDDSWRTCFILALAFYAKLALICAALAFALVYLPPIALLVALYAFLLIGIPFAILSWIAFLLTLGD